MSWGKVDIGNLVTLRQGFAINKKTKHFLSDVPTDLPLLRIADMKNGTENVFVNDTIPKKFIAKSDDIIYTRTGQVGLVFTNQFGVIHNNCFTVTPRDETILCRRYLYYALQDKAFFDEANSKATGAAQPDLPHDAFNTISIYLPPIDAQHRITDILSAYDDLIENNRKQIKLLEEAAQRLYKEWFVDLRFPGHEHTKIVDGVPEGWKRRKLVDIAQVQYGYAFDGSLFNSQKIGTPIIRIRNIPQGQTEDYTPENVDSQYLVYNGDIIVGMDGEFHINTWAGDTAYLVQRTCRIKALTSDLNGFLLWAIYEPIKYFEKTVVGATVAHLGKKHIDTVEILVPTEKFYLPFKSLFEARLLLMNQNRALAEARDRLLPKLMSGEVEV